MGGTTTASGVRATVGTKVFAPPSRVPIWNRASAKSDAKLVLGYRTRRGAMFLGKAESFLGSGASARYTGRVQLIFTSPPFPLNHKKRYGNLQGDQYVEWLASFGPLFRELLRPDGSVVLEIGNAWEPGQPLMSTLALKALLAFQEEGGFNLCQTFICHNPARLPGPAQWVNVERIRVKDSFTYLWWLSATDRPNADNRRVLNGYSQAMRRLLSSRKYSSGKRPSGHRIGRTSFLKSNNGAIPSNVLSFSNTGATDSYRRYCQSTGLAPHPARMPTGLPDFFIRFLTKPQQTVLDPFAGSNTTGAVAERLKRRWVSIEPNQDYVAGSRGRFQRGDRLVTSNSLRKRLATS
jgi:site-specific DNA-methyltransferase (cytosine-N4-specific)